MMRIVRHVSLISTVLIGVVSSVAHAAHDCSVIYDEFESLMHKQFLVQPGDYLPVAEAQLSEFDFAAQQQGKFLLYEEREDAGILIFLTGENRYGKLLYRWSDPLPDNRRHLLILEGLYYEAVASGLLPTRFGPIRVSANMGVDLDAWQLVAVDQTVLDRRAVAMQGALRAAQTDEAVANDPFMDAFSSPQLADSQVPDEALLVGLEIEEQVEILIDEPDIADREGMIETDFSVSKTEADLMVWQDDTGVYYVGATELGQTTFPLMSLCEFGTTDYQVELPIR
jgi:hypothetical protein